MAGGAPKVVARKDTFVLGGFGSGATEITDPDNINPYSLGGLGRVRGLLNLTMYEFLYLYNHNDGSEIPWLAESYKVAPDFKSVDVKIRKGVEWNDGKPFTSADVKFTLDAGWAFDSIQFSNGLFGEPIVGTDWRATDTGTGNGGVVVRAQLPLLF